MADDTIQGSDVVVDGKFGRSHITQQEASRRGVEARKRNAAERAKQRKVREAQMKELKHTLNEILPPIADLGELAGQACLKIITDVLTDKIVPKGSREAAQLLTAVFNVMRLEKGQSTGMTEHVSREERVAEIQGIIERARNTAS